ncbi:hypothetical protein EON65_43785 [archaeon]|nr:MAG: hypothetical protein EON65_43785 [archaeon]
MSILLGAFDEARRKTRESLHPLKLELGEIEDQIAERLARIAAAKAATVKNEEKIVQMLRLMATS